MSELKVSATELTSLRRLYNDARAAEATAVHAAAGLRVAQGDALLALDIPFRLEDSSLCLRCGAVTEKRAGQEPKTCPCEAPAPAEAPAAAASTDSD